MKREIKFRAWHKTQKQMFTGLFLTFQGKMGIWNNEETEIDFDSDYSFLELMQYTGLKDKNGKEIFEGDVILSHTNHTPPKEYKHLVEWKDLGFNFKSLGTGLDKVISSTMLHVRDTNVEIIGNIYENPELNSIESEEAK